MKNILNYKKPVFGIIIVTLLTCIVVTACFLTNLNNNSALTPYEKSGQMLSELSEDECLAFIASQGIEIPDELLGKNTGRLVKEIITLSEKYPQSPAAYSYTVTMDFAEIIRKAVNTYYGLDGGNYLIQENK